MIGDPVVLALIDEMRERHIEKSSGYGTGDDPLANFVAVAHSNGRPPWEYALDRDTEKTARLRSLIWQDRLDDLEEEFLDKAGLMLCAAALLRRSRPTPHVASVATQKGGRDADR
jgi:hypothetical protein